MKRNKATHFVICVKNKGCDDLIVGKVYKVLPDQAAIEDSYLRIIDESGEDYLYPANFFVAVNLPKSAERVFASQKSKVAA